MSGTRTSLVLHTFAPLRIEEGPAEITVCGTTFSFGFSKANGLIRSVKILRREWLSRRPLPDLWCSERVDPREHRWEAAHEKQAQVEARQASDEQVVIAASGRYFSSRGEPGPLRYHLTYTIDCDGVMRVDVEHEALAEGVVRWLVFSAASVRRSLVDFYSHIGDLAYSEGTGDWVTTLLPPAAGRQQLHAARILPWMQLGNDASGLDLAMDHAEEISHGWTDSEPYADPFDPENRAGHSFVLGADHTSVGWTYFSIRNLHTPIRPGWKRSNRFFLSPVPAKAYQPGLADLRVHWLGPHQWKVEPFTYPSNEEIAGLARSGINVVVGGAHWRSGDYEHPDNPGEIRRVIAACHRNGIRIIPYITFTDLEYDAPMFPEHGEEWRIEPVAEYKHQTNLMCYGAEGWREHWRRDVDTILDRFDFDGLYIDFWVGKLACRNVRHGCGRKYPRFTLSGLREMAWHAYRRVKEKGADKFILCNTNLFAGALINNLVDIRLPGEWANIEETPEVLTRGHLNSRRLGCNALLLRRREVSLRSVSFSLHCQSMMVMGHGRPASIAPVPPSEPEGLLMRYADMLRFFGIGHAETQPAFEPDGVLEWTGPAAALRQAQGRPTRPRRASPERSRGAAPYWSKSDRGTLIVLPNLSSRPSRGALRVAKPAALGIQARRRYLMYRPDRGELLTEEPLAGDQLGPVSLALRSYEPALLFIVRSAGRPQVLWATLSDGIGSEQYDGHARRLCFVVKGAPGGRSRVTVYAGNEVTRGRICAGANARCCTQRDQAVRIRQRGALAVLDVACNEPVQLTFAAARYQPKKR
jgi:hypothetical protein